MLGLSEAKKALLPHLIHLDFALLFFYKKSLRLFVGNVVGEYLCGCNELNVCDEDGEEENCGQECSKEEGY